MKPHYSTWIINSPFIISREHAEQFRHPGGSGLRQSGYKEDFPVTGVTPQAEKLQGIIKKGQASLFGETHSLKEQERTKGIE